MPNKLAKYKMTEREIEVLRLLCLGKTNMEIAETLGCLDTTVKTHVYRVYNKIKIRSRAKVIVAMQDNFMTKKAKR